MPGSTGFPPTRRRFSAALAMRQLAVFGIREERDDQAMQNQLTLAPIGFIETPFREPAGTPIQPSRAQGARGRVHVAPEFQAGLTDLGGFERIWLVYWFHRAAAANLLVTPFLDTRKRGVFSTRAPARPSPIGISAVRLLEVREGGILEISDVDILDGTPLLDIKPYVPEFDSYARSRAGWFDESGSKRGVADERFDRGRGPGKGAP